MKLAKNNFRLGEIQPSPVLLDYASAFFPNKGPQRVLLGEQIDPILHFR